MCTILPLTPRLSILSDIYQKIAQKSEKNCLSLIFSELVGSVLKHKERSLGRDIRYYYYHINQNSNHLKIIKILTFPKLRGILEET